MDETRVMELSVQALWAQKLGNTPEEYEDASAASLEEKRFAIADGATESSFADRWARSLVAQYTIAPPLTPPSSVPLAEWLEPLQQEWFAGINWGSLPWYAEEKARSGAFATLLGLNFVGAGAAPAPERPSFWNWLRRRKPAPPRARWHALAVGDSCLVQVRHGALLKSFPLQTSAEFSDRPLLISSNPNRNQQVWSAVQFAEGDCLTGDLFLLMTDALAKWFLQQREAGGRPWQTLAALRTQGEFVAFVDKQRQDRALKNDDTTLVHFTWPGEPEPAGNPGPPTS